ncbi:MAG: NYN domain-containing protein [Candidatus Nealsonbacteria bacterium]
MKKKENNYAFIDSQNLNLGIRSQGWILIFDRFRIYLQDKYGVTKTFLFIGYVSGNEALYTFLQEAGYIIIFKPTLEYKKEGELYTKGNVDAELVLHAMIEYSNYNKAIIVSGDGDFHCLVEYLQKQNKLFKLIIPDRNNYSSLLRKFMKNIVFMNLLKQKLSYKKFGNKE